MLKTLFTKNDTVQVHTGNINSENILRMRRKLKLCFVSERKAKSSELQLGQVYTFLLDKLTERDKT